MRKRSGRVHHWPCRRDRGRDRIRIRISICIDRDSDSDSDRDRGTLQLGRNTAGSLSGFLSHRSQMKCISPKEREEARKSAEERGIVDAAGEHSANIQRKVHDQSTAQLN